MATIYGQYKVPRGDWKLYATPNGGEFAIEGGETDMDVLLYTALYLSMSGGNFDDPGGDDESKSWWGNRDESDINKQYRGRTQYLLRTLPATSANLKRIEDAVMGDIKWVVDVKAASSVLVGAQLIAPKRVKIIIAVFAEGDQRTFEFIENWVAQAEEVGVPRGGVAPTGSSWGTSAWGTGPLGW